MLQIKNISKQFKTGDLVQVALDNVSLNFRDSEFVSILGPSGSGKTTLLNIIGGLDRYDSGDLIINNVSTKKYKDRDWDSYRNHTVGFVFQSYNLIPHQTILANVELALTISGISKRTRKRRALEALEKVGLREQAHKKPTQMSGGQMQRVAIARALVNDPDILLADEPTGALDTATSVQVMELLKEVAKDRLVVMVTHNPELAEQYSTRIVKLRDGKITDDSNSFEVKQKGKDKPRHKNLGKSSMSMPTAFSLSLNNLLTKKGRTILTSFAGSIGIIGIAMILSLSTGFQNYIDKIQEDTLTSYPLTLESETADAAALILGQMGSEEESAKKDRTVVEKQNIANMFSTVGKNDLKSFKKYVEDNQNEVDKMVSLVNYQYSIAPMIYTEKEDTKELLQLNPSDFISSLMGSSSSMMGAGITIFGELINDDAMVKEQYEMIEGRWPTKFDELMVVLPDEDSVSDLLLYALGLRDLNELEDMIAKLIDGEKVENTEKPLELTYDDLLNIDLKLIDPSSTYKYNKKYDIYENMSEDEKFMKDVYKNGVPLKIVGIVKPTSSSGSLTSGVLYTRALTEYVMKEAAKSEIVKKQLADKNVNVFSGKRFDDEDKNTGLDFQDMVSIDEDALSKAFGVNISEDDIKKLTEGYIGEISSSITTDTTKAKAAYLDGLKKITKNILTDHINSKGMGGIAFIKMSEIDKMVDDGLKSSANDAILSDLESKYVIPKDILKSQMYGELLKGILKGYVAMLGAGGSGGMIPGGGAGTMPPVGGNTNTNTNSSTNTAVDNTVVGNTSTNTATNTSNTVGSIPGMGSGTGSGSTIPTDMQAPIALNTVDTVVNTLVTQKEIDAAADKIASGMTEAVMQKSILTKVGELTAKLMEKMANAFNVDTSKFASAFKFEMDEEEMKRLFKAMSTTTVENATTNLISLGYQDIDEPSFISFYFKDFDSKELFLDFLDDYNDKMEKEDEEKVINYTDITGILMSSVKTIVDSVSYVLIAFVSISLIVSSIMIGIITYISVLERTKEIGILRAIGASKRNISSIFNAETFIVGLFSGIMGIVVTLLLLIPTNMVIHSVNEDITAVLPTVAATILVILSVILTLIGGLIPSKQAAKKDPVLALRSE